MDDYQRTTQRVTTEEVIPTEPLVPVAPVMQAPASTAPVYAAPAAQAPVYAATPVVPAQVVASMAPGAPGPAVAPAGGVPAYANRIVTDRTYVREGPTALEMIRRIVALAFGMLQGLIILRVVLLLLVANRDNDIVRFILSATDPFVRPFRDMFALDRIAASGSILDIAAIVAFIGWTLVELLILAIVNLGARRRTVAY